MKYIFFLKHLIFIYQINFWFSGFTVIYKMIHDLFFCNYINLLILFILILCIKTQYG